MSALPYSRFPGPGDLPGDSKHPNAPDFNDMPFWNAADTVGRAQEPSDVVEMVERLVEAENALALVTSGRQLDALSLAPLRELLALSRGLYADVIAEMGDAA